MRRLKIAAFFILKLVGGFHLALWLHKRKLRVLCYHGFSIDDLHQFDDILFIRQNTFEKRMKILKKWDMNVIPLDEAVENLPLDKHPDHGLVITFDDGWYSNLQALPALKKYNFPATLYVASYYSNKGTNVFNVLMRYLFWKTKSNSLLIKGIDSSIDGDHDLTDLTVKDSIRGKIIELGNRSDLAMKDKLSHMIANQLGIDLNNIQSNRMFQYLNASELHELIENGVTCELHTHRHQFPVDQEQVEKEVSDNRNSLNEMISGDFNHLCYPSGFYSRSQFPWMKKMGIKSATTTNNGFNSPTTHLYELNRFLDRETLTDIEFEAELCGLTELLKKVLRPDKWLKTLVYPAPSAQA